MLALLPVLALLQAVPRPATPPPSLVVWAWERPEELRALPLSVGVAFHRATLTLAPDGLHVRPRRQPLRVREGAHQTAVIRVELAPHAPAFSDATRAELARFLASVAREPGIRAVQLDYDAPASRRTEYRTLLTEVRAALGPSVWFSMTALASWCEGDRWLEEPALPVDEVVPMVFTMGPRGPALLDALRRRGRFASPVCQRSLGEAVGEPRPAVQGVARRYVFNARSWQLEALAPWLPSASSR